MIFEDDIYGDLPAQYLESFRTPKPNRFISAPTALAYGILAATTVYHMLQYFDYPVLPISELAWNILVYLTPSRAISALDPRVNNWDLCGLPDNNKSLSSRRHALKSEALRRIIGLEVGGILGKVQQAQSLPGVGRLLPARKRNMNDESPPGLGNWDNSCYQNSVIQGLASLQHLPEYLARSAFSKSSIASATALRNIIATLNDPSNVGRMFWNPAALKTMNSWQQQDAQEYFSKVLDEVGKDVASGQVELRSRGDGLALLSDWQESTTGVDHSSTTESTQSIDMKFPRSTPGIGQYSAEIGSTLTRSPLEGLVAQRVGCLQCGYVEGLSLIPFNCLTVPLGSDWIYDIRTCLDNYTDLEPISGVECVKCTLLSHKLQLERIYAQTRDSTQDLNKTRLVTQALQDSIQERLSAVEKALDENDFSDSTILKKCQIPTNRRVSTTKSRQAVIARAPKSLVIHVNRSVFDEATGMQCKNVAEVMYPLELDLTPWCLGSQSPRNEEVETVEEWIVDPSKSMLSLEAEDIASSEIDGTSPSSRLLYNLRAVITHYGRHENGHYMCYRKHRLGEDSSGQSASEKSQAWWCFNDDEVSKISEATVLRQGGVFMLFYEQIEQAKDAITYSPKDDDLALLSSLSGPVETISEKKEIIEDDCVPSEAISTSHFTNIEEVTSVSVLGNVHSGPLSTDHSAGNQSLEEPEASTPTEEVNDATSATSLEEPKASTLTEEVNDAISATSQTISASLFLPSTFQESREARASDESPQEPSTMPENNSIEPSPEIPSSEETSLVEPSPAEPSPVGSFPIEPFSGKPYSAEPFPAESFSAEPFSAEPSSAEPFPAEPSTAEPFSEKPSLPKPSPAESSSEKPSLSESSPAEPFSEKPSLPESSPAEPSSGEPFLTESSTAEPFLAKPSSAEAFPAETFPAETFSSESFLAESFSAKPSSSSAEPSPAEASSAETFLAEPSSAEASSAESSPTESSSAEPSSAESSSAEPSSVEPSAAEPSPAESSSVDFLQVQSFPENPSSTEPLPIDDTIETEPCDTTISTIDENTNPIIPPEPDTAQPDDAMPDNNPKPNHHPPMRTAPPRSSRGSVSRAGKAMSNVSTMVIAN